MSIWPQVPSQYFATNQNVNSVARQYYIKPVLLSINKFVLCLAFICCVCTQGLCVFWVSASYNLEFALFRDNCRVYVALL